MLDLACLHSGQPPCLGLWFSIPQEHFKEEELQSFQASSSEATRLFRLVETHEDKYMRAGKSFGAFIRGVRYHRGLGLDVNKDAAVQNYLLCISLASTDPHFNLYLIGGVGRVYKQHLSRLYEDEEWERFSPEMSAQYERLAQENGYNG